MIAEKHRIFFILLIISFDLKEGLRYFCWNSAIVNYLAGSGSEVPLLMHPTVLVSRNLSVTLILGFSFCSLVFLSLLESKVASGGLFSIFRESLGTFYVL